MDDLNLGNQLDALVGKNFRYQDVEYKCINWEDWEMSHKVQIVTNSGTIPELSYRQAKDFLREIVILKKEEDKPATLPEKKHNAVAPIQPQEEEEDEDENQAPVMPQMINELLQRHNLESAQMSEILLNVAKEIKNSANLSSNQIERAKMISLLSTSLTNHHKAQTLGIAEVGKLFYKKAPKKPRKQIEDKGDKEPEE